MKYFKYTWTIIWNIILVLFALIVLSELDYQGGSQDVAALVFMLMGSVRIGLATEMRTNLALFALSTKQNATILNSLGKNNEAESLSENGAEIEKMLSDSKNKYWINSIGSSLISIIALLTLLD